MAIATAATSSAATTMRRSVGLGRSATGSDTRNSRESAMSNRMWGGRFSSGPDAIMEEINASIGFDQRLYRQDIAGSIAHATMLAEAGILTHEDRDAIVNGLNAVLTEIESQKFNFSRALEDIHMNVESRLRELIGDAAGRLHTARS